MHSPTHSLLALAALSKAGATRRNWAVFMGSVIPDLVIYLWYPYQVFIKGETRQNIWRTLYFEAPMQTLIALFNSIPIYMVIAVAGYVALRRGMPWGKIALFFALAALIHIATDMPVHAHDAYRHFWPLSDWRFHSPFSYYERDLHAQSVSLIEGVIALISIVILWRRFPYLWVKIVLGVFASLYIGLQFIWH